MKKRRHPSALREQNRILRILQDMINAQELRREEQARQSFYANALRSQASVLILEEAVELIRRERQ